ADLPSEKDLDLSAAPAPAPTPVPTAPAPATALPEVSFDLDLGSFDDPKPLAAPEAATPASGIELRSLELPQSFDEQIVIESAASAEPLPAAESVELIELELDDKLFATEAPQAAAPAPMPEPEVSLPETTVPVVAEVAEAAPAPADDDQVKVVGDLRISIPLFNIYLNEADELSRRLTTEVAEWAMELHRPVGETPIALAHSLAGNSATVGFADLSHLARLVEHALMRSQAIGSGTPDEARLFVDASEEVRRLLHQFAAGFLKPVAPELLQRLADHEISSARRLEAANAAANAAPEVIEPVPVEAPVVLQEPVEPPAPRSSRPIPLEHGDDALVAHVDSSFGGLDTNVGSLGQAEFKALAPLPVEETSRAAPVRADALDGEDDIDAVDAVDAELFPIFEEEAEELLPQLDSKLREWARRPTDNGPAAACMRTLHTLKGGARLAGAMRLGEMAHRLETAIEHLLAQPAVTTPEVDALHARSDALSMVFEALRSRDAQAYAEAEDSLHAALSDEPVAPPPVVAPLLQPVAAPPVLQPVAAIPAPVVVQAAPAPAPAPTPAPAPVSEPAAQQQPAAPELQAQPSNPQPAAAASRDIDWSRFAGTTEAEAAAQPADRGGVAASSAAVRVRGPLLERLVNQAGEVSITRSRIESEVGNMRGSLNDLTDNLERLRLQLRDIEFQAETQMISRQEAAKAAHEAFDPLESDRFTRFQELTRMMAESVNDVATVQRTLTRTLETTEDELASQARLTRDLQDDLLRTRMVEFEAQSDRLYRVVRQAAKETGKQVRLDILGGSIEIDRGVLDRMTPAFEHLLRNCVTHGIEKPEVRSAAGKDATGNIVVALHQEGNEVAVEFRDDGAGLNLARIRDKGVAMGLLKPNEEHSAGDLANLIFTPGFSTAETVTELAGRGVGMDVVRSEVNAMGGRIETATAAGQGTSFKLVLPLTTAVTQVVMVRSGSTVVALPATLIEIVRRASAKELEDAYASGTYTLGERALLFFWFGSLLQESAVSHEPVGRTRPVVVVRSAQQRIALHVDEVLGTQEVVVKNLGPQLSRLPGLAGMTLLASGAVALIYNPVALATLFGESARAATVAALRAPTQVPVAPSAEEMAAQAAPLVLVVDDSLTVRRVTQRLLVREGYRVTLAKDGIEALERLAEELPQVVLSDIEMPRMDGFDLVRNIRGDTRLRALPVIMITSRIAQKHRDYAAELGVDHYLGKPYSEEDLLALIGRYTAMPTPA
ncbi:MAG TPA: response regulator, partial [Rhizobacter sp.]